MSGPNMLLTSANLTWDFSTPRLLFVEQNALLNT